MMQATVSAIEIDRNKGFHLCTFGGSLARRFAFGRICENAETVERLLIDLQDAGAGQKSGALGR